MLAGVIYAKLLFLSLRPRYGFCGNTTGSWRWNSGVQNISGVEEKNRHDFLRDSESEMVVIISLCFQTNFFNEIIENLFTRGHTIFGILKD